MIVTVASAGVVDGASGHGRLALCELPMASFFPTVYLLAEASLREALIKQLPWLTTRRGKPDLVVVARPRSGMEMLRISARADIAQAVRKGVGGVTMLRLEVVPTSGCLVDVEYPKGNISAEIAVQVGLLGMLERVRL